MPNYGLVVTPTYNPMSYEQYVKPFQDYAQVYNATADQIDALEMEASQWEKLANNKADAPEYATYKKYADDLRGFANALANEGLSTRTRAGLSNMRQRYFKEIKPIEEAYDYRQKLAEEQRKLNPTGDLQYDVDFSQIGLTEIMNNPTLGYKARSLSEMEQEAAQQAASASSRRLVTQKAKNMGGQYYQILQGYGQEAARKFLEGVKEDDPKTYKELVDIYNQVRTSYGTNSENSIYSKEQNIIADERILNGMMKGLSLSSSYQTNRGYDYAMESRARAGSGRGSGGGSSSVRNEPQPLGYEINTEFNGKNRSFTVINEKGTLRYYNERGEEVTPSTNATLYNHLLKEQPEVRYMAVPYNNSADNVAVYDMRTGMYLTQNNGDPIYFNKNNEFINMVDLTTRSKFISGNAKKPETGGVVIAATDNSGDPDDAAIGTGYTKEQVEDFIKTGKAKHINYTELNEGDVSEIPEEVRFNPDAYTFYEVKEDSFFGNKSKTIILWQTSGTYKQKTQNNQEQITGRQANTIAVVPTGLSRTSQ